MLVQKISNNPFESTVKAPVVILLFGVNWGVVVRNKTDTVR